jgi:hypothetical protein
VVATWFHFGFSNDSLVGFLPERFGSACKVERPNVAILSDLMADAPVASGAIDRNSTWLLREFHEGTFRMMAAGTFEGPLSVLRTIGLDTCQHHHRLALWARWPFCRNRSCCREPESKHFALL